MNKKVVIKSCGPIGVLKGICGPVLTPINLSEDDIYNLLMTKKVVCEILDNGKEFPLNMDNYDIDNNEQTKKENNRQNRIDVTRK